MLTDWKVTRMDKTELQIAQEVLQGKWGAGEERKNRINKAGYDYNTVQSFVNRMVETGLPIKEVHLNRKECSGAVIYVEVG